MARLEFLDTFSSKYNFLDQEHTPKLKAKLGLIMWFALYLGYFTFCFNWLIFSNFKGSGSGSGWAKDVGLSSDQVVASDAVNYAITFMRGVVTIGVAWFMTRLSHKWASTIALLLNTAALPLVFASNFALMVFGRMMMAAGGTMMVILLQPVLAKFFDLRMKGVLSSITPTSYIFAALIANAIFLYEGQASAVTEALRRNWKPITAGCAAISYIPLLLYVFWGRNFHSSQNENPKLYQQDLPQNTYEGIIKERSTWFWVFWYSFLLVNSLLVSIKVPIIISSINKDLVEKTYLTGTLSWKQVYIVFFYLGCLGGMTLGKWSDLKFQRKPIIILSTIISALCWFIIFGAAHIKGYNGLATGIILLSVFTFSFFALGIQSVILYVPHEYAENHNAKRVAIFYSYLWGIGYVIYTIYQIIVSSLIGMSTPSNSGSSGTVNHTGNYLALSMISLFIVLYVAFAFTIKESRPEYKFFPKLDKMSDLWNRPKNNRFQIRDLTPRK